MISRLPSRRALCVVGLCSYLLTYLLLATRVLGSAKLLEEACNPSLQPEEAAKTRFRLPPRLGW